MNPYDEEDEAMDDAAEAFEDEDLVALQAVQAWLEIEGTDELAQASREALAAIAEEVLALKATRQRREAAERRTEARLEAERLAERERAERWEAERRAQAALRAAVERAHARIPVERRVEPSRPVPSRYTTRRSGQDRPASPVRRPRRVELPPVVVEPAVLEDVVADFPAEDDSDDVHEVGLEPFESKQAIDAPEEPERFLSRDEALVLTGADLAAWRVRHGLTQEEAAARLGVSQGTVSKGESRGARALGPAVREALARVLAEERGETKAGTPDDRHAPLRCPAQPSSLEGERWRGLDTQRTYGSLAPPRKRNIPVEDSASS